MISLRKYLGKTLLFFLFFATLFPALQGEAVTRGRIVADVVQILGLPSWTEKQRFSDVPPSHPFANAIEAASALGVLLPGSHFYPDLEATRVEALTFAFLAMGWRKEGQIVQALEYHTLPPDIPPHLASFLRIASKINIPPPSKFLSAPRANCTIQDLSLLKAWLVQCRKNRLIWETSFPGESGTLIVHRENLGAPPKAWAVQVLGFLSLEEAQKLRKDLQQRGLKTSVTSDGFGYTLRLGPYKHYFQAWKVLFRVPFKYSPSIVPYSGGAGGALFWCAIKGSSNSLDPAIVFSASLGEKRLPLSRIAEICHTEGAINGGYFSGGTPIGTIHFQELPQSSSYQHRSAVGWNANNAVTFGDGAFQSYLDTGEKIFTLDYLNSNTKNEGLQLVTPHRTPWARMSGPGLICQLQDAKVEWHTSNNGVYPVPQKGFMCMVHNQEEIEKTLGNLPKGSPVRVITRWNDPEMENMDGVIQGGPMLFKDGIIWGKNEGLPSSFINNKHPRTIVGFDGSHMWWIVIDGRNSWHSLGVTLPEARRIAYALGLHSALNLDGGGSSTLWWQGIVVNQPSDGKERPLPYGILFGTPEEGDLTQK